MGMRRGLRAVWRGVDWLGSEARKFKVKLRYGSRVEFGRRVWLSHSVFIEAHDGGRVAIGARTFVGDSAWLSAKGGNLEIGADGLIGRGSTIVATRRVAIGSDALIAEYVTIRDQDHGHADRRRPFRLQGTVDGAVEIGANVWLGAKVTVTRGVRIPSDTIVGANAVVTKSIVASGSFAGVPARKIG